MVGDTALIDIAGPRGAGIPAAGGCEGGRTHPLLASQRPEAVVSELAALVAGHLG